MPSLVTPLPWPVLQLLRLILAGPRPLACRIYPPGVPLEIEDLKRDARLVIVLDVR